MPAAPGTSGPRTSIQCKRKISMFKTRFFRGALLAMSIATTTATASAHDAIVAAPSSDPAPLQLFVTLPVHAGQFDAFLATLQQAVSGARSEAGNIVFDVYENGEQPGTLHLFEHWTDAAALAAHTRQPYYQAVRALEADALGGDVEERKLSELAPVQASQVELRSGASVQLHLIRIQPGTGAQLAEAFQASAVALRSRPGNLGFALYQDLERPLDFLLIEHWHDDSARADGMDTVAARRFQAAVTGIVRTPADPVRLIDRAPDPH